MLQKLELPLRSYFRHQGRSTDVRIWPASKKPLAVILFICGNPGLIDYYTQFLKTLHAAAPDACEVIGVGHEGHSTSEPLSLLEGLNRPGVLSKRRLPTLHEQIQRKIAYVDEIRETYGKDVKLVLMGHSVLKARPDHIDAIYGLFPTISHIAITPNGLKLSPLFAESAITLVTSLLTVLRLLIPFSWLRLLVALATGQRRPASTVTTKLITSPSTVAAALSMAADEMRTIKDLDEDFLRQFGSKITLYFAHGSTDGWVGSSDRVSHITSILDSTRKRGDSRSRWYICAKGMPHAFCIEHSSTMANICAGWVGQTLKDQMRVDTAASEL